MMGGLVFMVIEKMCVGFDKDENTDDDRVMVLVGKEAYEGMLKRKGCQAMDFTGKAMKGFLFVYPEGFVTETDMNFWIKRALDFKKEAKKRK